VAGAGFDTWMPQNGAIGLSIRGSTRDGIRSTEDRLLSDCAVSLCVDLGAEFIPAHRQEVSRGARQVGRTIALMAVRVRCVTMPLVTLGIAGYGTRRVDSPTGLC
jgi:hypothetical protein